MHTKQLHLWILVIESSVGFVGLSESWTLLKVVDKFSGLSNGINMIYWLCCKISTNIAYFYLWANFITFYLFSWIKNILVTQMLVYLGLLMTFYYTHSLSHLEMLWFVMICKDSGQKLSKFDYCISKGLDHNFTMFFQPKSFSPLFYLKWENTVLLKNVLKLCVFLS